MKYTSDGSAGALAAIAATSTIVVVAAVLVLVPRASGWENVKRSFFNGEVFRETFPDLLDAFWLDVKIFLWCVPCIFVLSLAIAVARNTPTRRCSRSACSPPGMSTCSAASR